MHARGGWGSRGHAGPPPSRTRSGFLPEPLRSRFFDSMESGFAHVRAMGETVDERAREAARVLPDGLVYAGFS
jgi:hypothetical protein